MDQRPTCYTVYYYVLIALSYHLCGMNIVSASKFTKWVYLMIGELRLRQYDSIV